MRFLASRQEVSVAILVTEMNIIRNAIYTGCKKSIGLVGKLMEKNSVFILFICVGSILRSGKVFQKICECSLYILRKIRESFL